MKLEIDFKDKMAREIASQLLERGGKKMLEAIATIAINMKKEENAIDPTYTVYEVASLTNKNHNTILAHIRRGLLKASRPGKNYLITKTNYDEYINDNT
jgi:excisionase family DNA binding protein